MATKPPCAAPWRESLSCGLTASISRERRRMSALVFVDTNVLIYALDKGNPRKQALAQEWRTELWKSRRGRISFQVLQEFYVKVVHKWPASRSTARMEVRDLLAWRPVAVSGELLQEGWKVQDRFRLSFWDALIVAAAKAS